MGKQLPLGLGCLLCPSRANVGRAPPIWTGGAPSKACAVRAGLPQSALSTLNRVWTATAVLWSRAKSRPVGLHCLAVAPARGGMQNGGLAYQFRSALRGASAMMP
eukprot:15474256-Alexandrium_andersonii.AAC.1